MSDKLKVSCIQMDMAFGSSAENFVKAERLIREAAKANPDVIVLPETWNTGFFPEESIQDYCDRDGEKTKALLGSLASELKINIVGGSVANVKEGKMYNTAYIFDREGNCIGEYDKTHLFSPMKEDKRFAKGDHICKFKLDGKECGIIICYDIRFPEITRMMTVNGLDCMFVVSQWPAARVPHQNALVKARAIENQMFVVCCNSCGKAGRNVYGGNSRIVDPWGEEIVCAGETEEIIIGELDFGVIENIRTTINVFADRRPELYDGKI
ncbi:MAG: carbon-nitrogen family hydrolase [Clostridia bacterium]|nr:carbon-nitrogen family hydrolase [Clostridia bacterium]